MTPSITLVVAAFLISAVIGVYASLTERRALLAVFKPLTTLILVAVVGIPRGRFAWLVDVGIVFSLGGDVALLLPAKNAFMAGLCLFLVAHAAYIAAFALSFSAVASPSPMPLVAAASVMIAVTLLLLRKLWSGAAGLRAPLIVYGAALATMVVTAFAATTSGADGVPISAAFGAALFYVSDASLAIDRFASPIKYAPLLTLGVYWLGQLGIALAARFAVG